jgi:membrane protein required for colicin V production
MTPVDFVILFLVLVSAAVGVWRGFTTEALSIVILLVAIGLAWTFAGRLEPMLGQWSSAVIFVAALAVGGLVSWLARKLVKDTGLTSVDRTLGAAFGLLRGAVLLGLAVLVLQFVGLDQEPWWRDAGLRPYAERAADAVKYYAELGTRYLQEQQVLETASVASDSVGAFLV